MKTLARHLLLDFVGPFLLALFVLTFILLMDRLFLMVDLLVRKGIAFATIAELIGLSMPFVLTISTPLAMLIAAVMAFGRASHDNEIAAVRTAGIHVFRLFVPIIIVGIGLFVLMVWFNGYVAPEASLRLRNLMMDMATKKPAIRLEPGIFLTDFDGYTIYIGALDEKTSRVRHVRIYDRTSTGTPDLIVAPRGSITPTPDQKFLILKLDSGSVHQYLGEGKYRRLEFREHSISLPVDDELVRKDREYRGNREMTLSELSRRIRVARGERKVLAAGVSDILSKAPLSPPDSMRLDEARTKLRYKQREVGRFSVEFNKRFSLAFSCFLFLFFGAPLGILLRRGGLGIGFLTGLVFFTLFYILLLAGEELATSGRTSPFLGLWLDNLLLLPVAIELCARTFFERSFVDPLWRRLRHWLRRPIRPVEVAAP